MKRTRPSISALLASAPHAHAKLPPLAAATALTAAATDAGDGLHAQPEAAVADPRGAPPSLRSSADGSTAHGGSALTQGARAPWQETSYSASGAAPGEQRPAASPPPWGPAMPAGQEDHLLLRQPAYVAALPAHPRLSEQARQDEAQGVQHEAALPPQEQQRPQQQQRAGWLDALHLPKLLRRSTPNQQQQQQQPSSADPADSFDAAAPAAAAGSSSSTSSRGSSSGRWKARRVRLLQALDSPGASWLLMVMTLFVIFQEDVKYAMLPPGADLGLEAVTLALLLLFLVEIGLSCVVRPHFFLSFYFWLDTVAVLSLAFELPALRAVLLLGATQEYVDLAAADSYLMAAGAQALVSSKAGRAAKMVRLFRQLQLIRLFRQLEVRQRLKAALAAAEQALPDQGLAGEAELAAVEARVMAKYQGGQSRVGQRLSDLTMKRVISGVLAMLVVLPVLEISSGINGRDTPLALGGLHMLHSTAITAGSASQAFSSSLQAFQSSVQYELAGQKTGQLLLLVVANTTYITSDIASQVALNSSSSSSRTQQQLRRYLEMQAVAYSSWVCPLGSQYAAPSGAEPVVLAAGVAPGYAMVGAAAEAAAAAAAASGGVAGGASVVLWGEGCEVLRSFVLMDIKWALQAQSVYGIARTLFLALLLAAGAMLIHQDTYRLVLQPVQRMVERVREMAEDPLMLAAVRSDPPAAAAAAAHSSSGAAGGTDSAPSSSGGGSASPGAAALLSKEQQQQQPGEGGGWSSKASPQQSSRPSRMSRIRFWPSVQVHALAGEEGEEGGTSADGSSNSKASALGQQLQQQLKQRQSGRVSGAQMLLAGTQRLSVTVAAGVSAAGAVAARLGQQLRARTSAMRALLLRAAGDGEEAGAQGQYETRLLEQSIYKICALLAVGFGDAGAEVIAENIRKEGDLNPIVPGRKMVAVFGFCDIRRFTDTTEVLQEGVMEFVNTIAHLVHGAVAARGGAANKNIGDAFLLVWKLPKGLDERDVSMLSSSGGGQQQQRSSGGGSNPGGTTSRLRAATLNWPGLAEQGSDDEEEEPAGPAAAASSPRSSQPGSRSATPARSSGVAAAAAAPQGSSCSGGAGAEELSRQLSTALAAQMTLQRATSGLADLLPHSRHHGKQQSSSSSSGAGDSMLALPHQQQQQLGMPASGRSSSGAASSGSPAHSSSGGGNRRLRRAVMSLKSVRALPGLSAAAKATIINTIADNALASFVVIQVAISVSRLLARYAARPDLNARMPGFAVQMGFGLHVGWAIEGAIGSEYKIDASYLSPNVNLASRLEAATKQYGTPLLLSRDFVDCLSPRVRAKVRQVDCVTVKGSVQPLGLFTYDLDLTAAQAAVAALATAAAGGSSSSHQERRLTRDSSRGSSAASPGLPPAVRHSLAVLPGAAGAARSSVVVSSASQGWGGREERPGLDDAELLLAQEYDDDWLANPVLAGSWGLDWDFKEQWDEALQLYLSGDWPAARRAFEACQAARLNAAGQHIEDGPASALLGFMAGHGFVAPPGWRGVRELTEK